MFKVQGLAAIRNGKIVDTEVTVKDAPVLGQFSKRRK
jgi:hypothetical protein